MPEYFGKFNRYEIVSLIGKGGMGEIYHVRDTFNENRNLALKALLRDIDIKDTQALQKEFILLSMLAHPNLISVYELEFPRSESDRTYYTMEYNNFPNLDETYDKYHLDEKLEIIKITLEALVYIHQRGILHLDLKPKNILLSPKSTPETLKIIDFGLSDLKSNLKDLEKSKGSLAFISPEVLAKKRDIDERADLYSLGALIMRIFSGKLFRIYTLKQKELQKLLERFIPSKMFNFVRKLLYFNREHRFQDSKTALDYYLDLMSLEPYILKKDDYLDIIRRNPSYELGESVKRVLTGIEIENARKIQVCGIKGIGKSRLLKEVYLSLQTKGYKTIMIGKSALISFDNYLLSQLNLYGIICDEEKQKLDNELSNIIKEHRSTRIRDLKRLIAYKIADYAQPRLKDHILIIDNIYHLSKYERDIINLFLAIPDICVCSITAQNRYIPVPGYDLDIILSNFDRRNTGLFISLCMGMRDIDPKSISEIYIATRGNPGNIIDYLIASLSHGIKESPEGLVFPMPAMTSFREGQGFSANILKAILNEFSQKDILVLYLITISPKALSNNEIKRILDINSNDLDFCLRKMVRMGLINDNNKIYSPNYADLSEIERKMPDSANLKSVLLSLADYISKNRYPYDPYKTLFVFRSIDKECDGFIELFKNILWRYKAGNPYNALDLLNYLIKEYKKSDIKSNRRIDFDIVSNTPYFSKPLLFDVYNLYLLKAELLRATGKHKRSYRLLNHILNYSDDLSDSDLNFHIRYSMAVNLIHLNEYDDAYRILEDIIFCIRDRTLFYYFQSVSQLCWIHLQRGEIERCEELILKHYDKIEELPVTLKMIKAGIYYKTTNFHEAIILLESILKAKKDILMDKSMLSTIYNNLGILYKLKANKEKSKEFLIRSYEIKKEIGAYETLSASYNNLGGIYMAEYDTDKAYFYFKKALISSKMLNDKKGILSASINIAYLYNIKGDFQQAINQLNRIIPLAKEIKSRDIFFHIYKNSILAMISQKRFEKAYYYLDLLENIIKETGNNAYYCHYKLDSVTLSLICLNMNQVKKDIKELSNIPMIRRDANIRFRYNSILMDYLLIISIINPGCIKDANRMIEDHIKTYAGSDIIDNTVIKYAVCYIFLTGNNILPKSQSPKDKQLKENLKLLYSITELLAIVEKTNKPDYNEKINRYMISFLNNLLRLEHLYINIYPFIIYRLMIFLHNNDLSEEQKIIYSYFNQQIKKRTISFSNSQRKIFYDSPILKEILSLMA